MSSLPVSGRRWLRQTRSLAATTVAGLALALLTPGSAATAAAQADPDNPWIRVDGTGIAARSARPADIRTTRFAGYTLDRAAITGRLDRVARTPLPVVLPTPSGEFQRFQLVDSPVMEDGLAAAHPEIRTFAGKGIDDPTATVRADLTPLGFHASVRSESGAWFVDPYFHRDQSLYASYFGHDLEEPATPLVEREAVEEMLEDLAPVTAEPVVRLRTYRLALVTDPSYATFFGAANVTAAKVTLINRVTHVYEDETAIRLVLINDTAKTNLNTAALATGPNGPCGAAACFTAAQISTCGSATLNRNVVALGQLVGAGNYDVGHLGLGVSGGGVAGLGVVGGANKARGCTGLPTPVGDFYAVDYVAHEIGHQFAGNHTFNGTQFNCSGGNRSAANSFEPGSGSSIMAYAGICRQDNLQPHSDPYWSHRSYTEITTFVNSVRAPINEVQTVSLREFDTDGDGFSLRFGDQLSAPIVRGTNYTTAGIKAAIETIRNWPAGATVTVTGFGGAALDDTGFQVTFNGGAVAATNLDSLGLADPVGASGFVGETVKGGAQDNGGFRVEDTANHAPVVSVPAASHTIPVRTPFALTGSATDADGDPLYYLWEQNDRGGATGTALTANAKTDGPLFRQFGTAAVVSPEDTLEYYSPGENTVTRDPTRVFPDLAQIAAGRINAATGACPPAPPPPTTGSGTNVPAEVIDCYSEFLPTPDWVGIDGSRTMHFRLTARDNRPGGGGVGSADTALVIAPDAGPFLVTSQGSATTVPGGSDLPLTWNVAGTDGGAIGATEVKVSLSVDGGATFPHVLAERTANDGSETVTLPDLATTKARIKVEALGNVFFDLNDADLTILASPRVSDLADVTVQYSDPLSATISASDPDSPGTALSAVATGLPAGLALAQGPASGPDTRPGERTWTVEGTTTAAPGEYPVSVAVTDDAGVVGTSTFTIRVTPEDAEVTYTGDALVAGRGGAPVLLRATIRDGSVAGADGAAGDIRTGTVTFTAGGTTLCSGAVGLLGTNTTEASASCTARVPLGVQDVSVTVGGNYTGTAPGRVEVIRSQDRSVIGAATLAPARSAGAFPADAGTRASVTVLAVHSRSGASTGLATVRFRSGGRHYQAVGEVESIGVRAGGSAAFDLRGEVTLVDITNPRRPASVESELTLGVTGARGGSDTLAVTLMKAERLLFSSDWTGARTQEIPVTNGGFLII
jgi:hypothetical protein